MPCWTSSDQYERVRKWEPLPIHTWDLVTLNRSNDTGERKWLIGPILDILGGYSLWWPAVYIYIYAFSRCFYPKWLTGYTFVFSVCCLDINGCVLSYFEGTANLHCYTSCTLTTLHCSKVSFLKCCHMKRYNQIFTKMWGVYSLLWDTVHDMGPLISVCHCKDYGSHL